MPIIEALPESEAVDKTARTFERIKDMLGTDTVPEPFRVYARVEAFLQDFFMNFKKFVHGDGALDAKTRAIIGLAVSSFQANKLWTDFFLQQVKTHGLTDEQINEVIAVASTNSMYNTFFKFRDIAGTDAFEGLGVGLRAHTFHATSFDDSLVELINIAISDMNACKPCVSGHVKKARDLGLSHEAILECIQCTAVLLAGIQFLKASGH